MDTSLKICFNKTSIYIYTFIIAILLCYFIYVIYFTNFKNYDIEDIKRTQQNLAQEIQKIRVEPASYNEVDSRFIQKRFNPLYSPENIMPQGGFYNKGYDANREFQQLGFITNEQGQFPVYGRYKDFGRSDRYEYYTINEGRNSIKIPFSVKNNEELYSDDQVKVPELSSGDFTFKKYEIENNRYH